MQDWYFLFIWGGWLFLSYCLDKDPQPYPRTWAEAEQLLKNYETTY